MKVFIAGFKGSQTSNYDDVKLGMLACGDVGVIYAAIASV